MNFIKYRSPFGIITVREKDGAISRVYLPNTEPDIPDIYESPLFKGGGGEADGGLPIEPSFLYKPPSTAHAIDTPFQKGALAGNDLLNKAITQFAEYFGGKRKVFDLPLSFDGCTDFMKSVYRELLKIPYGETVSYKYIAGKINCPKGFRAVGLANNKNPLPIIVPCHRVIGSDGKLVGYGGGIDLKIKLLDFEREIINKKG